MIRYYKLFDLLNRREMKKSDLRKVLSPKTVAKLSKGEYLSGEAIEKICLFLGCQPGDIMEIIDEPDEIDENTQIIEISRVPDGDPEANSFTMTVAERKVPDMTFSEADEYDLTQRQYISDDLMGNGL